MHINKNSMVNYNNVSFKKLDVQVESYQNWNPLALNTLVKSEGIRTLTKELALDKKDLVATYSEFKSPLDNKRNYVITIETNKMQPYRFVEPSIKKLCSKVEQFEALNFYTGIGSNDKTNLTEQAKSKLLEHEAIKLLKEFNKSLKLSCKDDSIKTKIKKFFD